MQKETHFSNIVGFIDLVARVNIKFQLLEKVQERWNVGYVDIVATNTYFLEKYQLIPTAPSSTSNKNMEERGCAEGEVQVNDRRKA